MKQEIEKDSTNVLVKYWRSLESRVASPEKKRELEREFESDLRSITELDRRSMLKFAGASVALAGVGVACRRPEEKILPYVKQPEDLIPGVPNQYATALDSPEGALGVVVESHEGRPTKVEGNALHVSSQGATSMQAQAAVLGLYDPDRSRFAWRKQAGIQLPHSWSEWDTFSQGHFDALAKEKGKGLAFLMSESLSPTRREQTSKIKKRFPKARFYSAGAFEKNWDEALSEAFPKNTKVQYHFEKAKVVLTLNADPIMSGPNQVRYAKDFAKGRKVYNAKDASKMSRLYAVEAKYSGTGANADHRLPLPVSESSDFLLALAKEIFVTKGLKIPSFGMSAGETNAFMERLKRARFKEAKFVSAVASDLVAHRGAALLVVGECHKPWEIGLGLMINQALAGFLKTISFMKGNSESFDSLASLIDDMQAGKVNTLFMLDQNPVYASPYKAQWLDALDQVKTKIHAGYYEDESTQDVDIHLPLSHSFEAWGDTRAYSGQASIVQPLISPLHQTRSDIELLAQIFAGTFVSGHDLVKQTWGQSEKNWRRALHDGVIKSTEYSSVTKNAQYRSVVRDMLALPKKEQGGLGVVFHLDYSVGNGSLANLGWLQEAPDPITKLCWGNAFLIGPGLARKLKVKSRLDGQSYSAQIGALKVGSVTVSAPVFVLPGIAEDTIVATLGYGREQVGQVGNGVGTSFYPLITKSKQWAVEGATLTLGSKYEKLASTQEQFAINGEAVQDVETLTLHSRNPARLETLSTFKKNPNFVDKLGIPKNLLAKDTDGHKKPLQMTKSWVYDGQRWGMSIDLNSCNGCNACVVACQAENNIPVVGKDQVMRGRVMHWIRVDRYFTGDTKNPDTVSQPVMCAHCENAPCEPVCPVAATSHDHEGLNVMTYNRCIGTRYCANNCPFKVRRFNYLDFTNTGNIYVNPEKKSRQKLFKMQKNPDVTIRYRGVMEKCTYCTQRIQEAKMKARDEGTNPHELPDGAVTPACAQSCPTNAIVFGNTNDEDSKVWALKSGERNYVMLGELNIRPQTSYLAKLKNLNSELV